MDELEKRGKSHRISSESYQFEWHEIVLAFIVRSHYNSHN